MEKQVQDIGRRLSALEKNFIENCKTVRELQSEVQGLKLSLDKALNSLMPKIDSLLSDRTNTDNISTVANPSISIVAPSAANLIAKEQTKFPPTLSTTKQSATSVFEAAETGDIETLLSHLRSGTYANKRNEKGYTLLHLAVSAGQEKTAKALLDAGASVDAKGISYRTSLHLAAENGFPNIVQMLLDAGADSNAEDTSKKCPLILASERGNAEAVMLMLQCNDPPNYNIIKDALSVAKDIGVVLAFEDVKPGILKTNDAELAMMTAAANGRVHSLKALLDAGVYVNARYGNKYTALWHATNYRNSECVKLLLERGAK